MNSILKSSYFTLHSTKLISDASISTHEIFFRLIRAIYTVEKLNLLLTQSNNNNSNNNSNSNSNSNNNNNGRGKGRGRGRGSEEEEKKTRGCVVELLFRY